MVKNSEVVKKAKDLLDVTVDDIISKTLERPPFKLYWNTLSATKQTEIKNTLTHVLGTFADKVLTLS